MARLASPVRVAVLGAGYFAALHHEAWSRLPEARLVGIADLDPAKAAAAAAPHGAAAFDALAPMLAATAPDLLDIAAPPPAHAAAIRVAIAAGIRAVICQKPFCRDLEEAEAVTAEAEAAGTLLVVHENFRFQPWHRAARAEIAAGRLGEVYGATFRLRPGDGQGPDAYLARQPYFRRMPRFLLHETGIHLIDLMRFLLGPIDAVFADLRRINPAIAGEDAGMLLARHASGARSLFDGNRCADHASADRRLTMGEMWIDGAEASLRLDGEGHLFRRARGATAEAPVPFAWQRRGFGGDCVLLLQAHVLDHLLGRGPVENAARDYLPNLRIETAAYRSAEAGAWQSP
ncbi:Gfo/Idh/MocA family protein [Roseomonas sp. HF4]|uniref:Gfo/Idh/MocA family protein n=1 Tax=Roseomonas sp. HF4 TaxID=2562313 RepID=UPI0010C0C553|nr:Gfo/Idh/MocA family oxidoreductase [Roseomonas sp. HF4]